MQEELVQFEKSQVYSVVQRFKNISVSGTKYIFRNKLNQDSKVVQNKARLVAQGYSQQEDFDYDEIFAPTSKSESIRILLTYAFFKHFKLFQIDVKSIFLNNFIKKGIFVKQPPDIENSYCLYYVFKLSKILYGLKQSP